MKIIFAPLFCLCLSFTCDIHSLNIENVNREYRDQVRQIAIRDFSETKLFRMDSVFFISFFDTVHRIGNHRVGKQNLYVVEKDFTEMIAVSIIATSFKYLLDTTAKIDNQNRAVPSRVFEKDGRLFLWRDRHFPLTDSTLKILDKFNLIVRGRHSDLDKFLTFGGDDSQLVADYYFCRNNLSKYKKVISNKAIGFYDPPNVRCK